MVIPETIHPINDNVLVRLEPKLDSRSKIHRVRPLLSAARRGMCIRPERWRNTEVLVSHGGIPVDDDENLVLVPKHGLISIDGTLQEPYVRVQVEEERFSQIIDVISDFFTGWYRVLETFPGCEVEPDDLVVPIYGSPKLEMEDGTEYYPISAIGVVQC